jgi:hypothetical protein
LDEIIHSLSSPDFGVRFVGIAKLRDMGPSAKSAVPQLIVALSDDSSDIRVITADALGEIGPDAAQAVPELIRILKHDEYLYARVSAGKALGKIGDRSVVPLLIETIHEQESESGDNNISIACAWAVAQLTNNPFPDSESGPHGYEINENGVPLIVLAVNEWWENSGKYQDWNK